MGKGGKGRGEREGKEVEGKWYPHFLEKKAAPVRSTRNYQKCTVSTQKCGKIAAIYGYWHKIRGFRDFAISYQQFLYYVNERTPWLTH